MSKFSGPVLPRLAGQFMAPGLRLYGKRFLPATSGSLTIPGLNASVEVLRDRWGVPHIYANTPVDLFTAQGFVHAQDRFFQMELSRRAASGRVAELVGEPGLPSDRMARVLGFRRLAPADWARLEPNIREIVEAYAIGVNAFLTTAGDKVSLEFKILGHSPEPWAPMDCMTLAKLQAWHMSHSWAAELTRARLVDRVGVDMAGHLEVHYPETQPAILPEGVEVGQLRVSDAISAGMKNPYGTAPNQGAIGSNSWVLSPDRTTTGGALLATDMHLELKIPGIWYLCHMETRDGSYRVTGATIPGVPGVIVGHNARIAWGATLGFCDQQDLFVEHVKLGDPVTYEHDGKWLAAESFREEIRVKGRAEPHVEQVLVTRHGPLVGEVMERARLDRLQEVDGVQSVLALQAIPLEPLQTLAGFHMITQANDWKGFVEGVSRIESPDLSLSFADVDGNVGYYLTGRVPVRAKGQGLVPAPGWNNEHDWVNRVPLGEMPHALNPKEGFVVTANNRVTGEGYPHFLSSCWMNGFRAERITGKIKELGRMGVEQTRVLQMDLHSLAGDGLVNRLADVTPVNPDARLALQMLRSWDRKLTAESAAGAIFVVFQATLVRAIIEPTLGVDLAMEYLGVGASPVLCPTTEFAGKASQLLLQMFDDPKCPWIDKAGGKAAVVERCLVETIATLRTLMGTDMRRWQWGKIHRAYWAHPFSSSGMMASAFDRGPYPIGGDGDTVHQSAYLAHKPYDCLSYSPSYRQIIDLAHLEQSLVIIPPGQSGHLASPHYDDLIGPWRAGEFIPMLWTRSQVDAHVEARLNLEPGPLL